MLAWTPDANKIIRNGLPQQLAVEQLSTNNKSIAGTPNL